MGKFIVVAKLVVDRYPQADETFTQYHALLVQTESDNEQVKDLFETDDHLAVLGNICTQATQVETQDEFLHIIEPVQIITVELEPKTDIDDLCEKLGLASVYYKVDAKKLPTFKAHRPTEKETILEDGTLTPDACYLFRYSLLQ